jgi:hypothetical protein
LVLAVLIGSYYGGCSFAVLSACVLLISAHIPADNLRRP